MIYDELCIFFFTLHTFVRVVTHYLIAECLSNPNQYISTNRVTTTPIHIYSLNNNKNYYILRWTGIYISTGCDWFEILVYRDDACA